MGPHSVSSAGVRIPAEIVEFAMQLRAALPNESFDRLRVLMRDLTTSAAMDVVAAPSEVMQVMQGRAQAYQAIATVFAQPEHFAEQLRVAAERQRQR